MQLVIYGIIVLGVLGALFGAILAFASKIFYVEVDPKQEQVRECPVSYTHLRAHET